MTSPGSPARTHAPRNVEAGGPTDMSVSATAPQLAPTPAPTADGKGKDNALTRDEQIEIVRGIRREIVEKYRPALKIMPSPIRLMAQMVRDTEKQALDAGVSIEVLGQEVVNRTIGDVNVRCITENIDGVDYSTIGEDLGLILPGEHIGGRISDGRVHHELNRRMEDIELRLLREYNWDVRIYDVYGVGNPLLREMLAARFFRQWGLPVTGAHTYITIGALDALYKSLLALGHHFEGKYGSAPTFAFPAPGFAVVNWQARVLGLTLNVVHTDRSASFKLTYEQLKGLLAEDPNLRLLYLTISNNPTAFSYSPEEIREVYRAIEEDGRELAVLADLAYIGTGEEAEDMARMRAFDDPAVLRRTLFINSLSKVYTLTGDRCGWISVQNDEWADILKVSWNNITAGLPAEWQLRFTAYIQMLDERPEVQVKIRNLYKLRREHLRKQLHEMNKEYGLLEEIGLDDSATIYNWTRLKPGEDALSLFEKSGIAGVPGSAFGYSDDYIRFSVGFIPIE